MVDKTITVLFIGDKSAKKVKFLHTFVDGKYDKMVPHFTFDTTVKDYEYDGKTYGLVLNDLSDMELFSSMRESMYNCCDVVVFCYNIADKESYQNIMRRHFPEFYHKKPTVLRFVVATHAEKREDENADQSSLVSEEEGKQLVEMIKASGFVECSYKNNQHIVDIFEKIIESVEKGEQPENLEDEEDSSSEEESETESSSDDDSTAESDSSSSEEEVKEVKEEKKEPEEIIEEPKVEEGKEIQQESKVIEEIKKEPKVEAIEEKEEEKEIPKEIIKELEEKEKIKEIEEIKEIPKEEIIENPKIEEIQQESPIIVEQQSSNKKKLIIGFLVGFILLSILMSVFIQQKVSLSEKK